MRLEILQEAEAEFQDAVAYYEAAELGLGIRLKQEVKATLAWTVEHSELPRLRPRGYRRVNLKIFPYYVAYACWADAIWILAVAHGHRRPEDWINRRPPAPAPRFQLSTFHFLLLSSHAFCF